MMTFFVLILLMCFLVEMVFATTAAWRQYGGKLVGLDVQGASQFATTIAISDDGTMLLTGGFLDGSNNGSAWFFTKLANGTWAQQSAKFSPTDTTSGMEFGSCVCMNGDATVAVIGAQLFNSSRGGLWLYRRTPPALTWVQSTPAFHGSDANSTNIRLGYACSLNSDGDTLIASSPFDNSFIGAAWVFAISGNSVTQQGPKLVAKDFSGAQPRFGQSVGLSGSGDVAIVGGNQDNEGVGAAWIWIRKGGVWTQQGSKLVGSGYIGAPNQGFFVTLNAIGDTAAVSGYFDNSQTGAVWVWSRIDNDTWIQQGSKLVGDGAVGAARQGSCISLDASGNTLIVGGYHDNASVGAAWAYTRVGSIWYQHPAKLIGAGNQGLVSNQGGELRISADGRTAAIGGNTDNAGVGAAWIFVLNPTLSPTRTPTLTPVSPSSNDATSALVGVGIGCAGAAMLITSVLFTRYYKKDMVQNSGAMAPDGAGESTSERPKVTSSFARFLPLNRKKYKVFISYHQAECKEEAQTIKVELERAFGEGSIFMDRDEGNLDLDKLKRNIGNSQQVLLLRTKEVFSRPYVLVEMNAALSADVPIIQCLVLRNFDGKRDFTTSKDYLEHLDTRLDNGAWQIVRKRFPLEGRLDITHRLATSLLDVAVNLKYRDGEYEDRMADIAKLVQELKLYHEPRRSNISLGRWLEERDHGAGV